MKNRLLIFAILLGTTHAWSQDGNIKPLSTGKHQPFIVNNGKDTILLEPIYKSDLTIGSYLHVSTVINSSQNDLELTDEVMKSERMEYTLSIIKDEAKVIHEIDLNKDGTKELVIYRELQCVVTPPNPGPYGVGIEQHLYTQYEVWDIHAKRRIFEVQNTREFRVAVSTNVMHSEHFSFDVEIGKNGTLTFSSIAGIGGNYEMGKYVYDTSTGEYKKE